MIPRGSHQGLAPNSHTVGAIPARERSWILFFIHETSGATRVCGKGTCMRHSRLQTRGVPKGARIMWAGLKGQGTGNLHGFVLPQRGAQVVLQNVTSELLFLQQPRQVQHMRQHGKRSHLLRHQQNGTVVIVHALLLLCCSLTSTQGFGLTVNSFVNFVLGTARGLCLCQWGRGCHLSLASFARSTVRGLRLCQWGRRDNLH